MNTPFSAEDEARKLAQYSQNNGESDTAYEIQQALSLAFQRGREERQNALLPYTFHKEICDMFQTDHVKAMKSECTCGFQEAISTRIVEEK